MDVYDVIVIGAGPAGSEFAYMMAKKGFNVLVLEKERLAREKPCGGGIPVQEMVEFGTLPSNAVERKITKSRIISPNNAVLEMGLSRGMKAGATVKRAVYDSFLQQRAKDAGAVFLERCSVGKIKKGKGISAVVSGKKKFYAKLVADASGYPCSIKGVSRELKDEDIVVTYHVWMKVKDIGKRVGNSIEIYCGEDVVPKGYAWIFPKKDVVSVGIGSMKDTIRSEKLSLKNLLRDFIKKHPVASKKLKGGRTIKRGGGLIPVALIPKLYSNNVVFIGDAGGFANPLHAGGIYQARKSAVIAAKHCEKFLKAKSAKDRKSTLEGYDHEAREVFHEHGSKWDLKMRNFFWNDALLEKIVEKAKKEPKVRDAIGTLLSMTRPHENSYNILESEMLDIIHSVATEKVRDYKDMVSKELHLFRGSSPLDRFARHSFYGDAKRLRVSLVLLSCDIFKGDLHKAAKLAPTYELLHTASLIHDDIMDDAKTRRGKRALHSICGVNNAIVTGDYMIGKTYGVLSDGLAGMSERQRRRILDIMCGSTTNCCHGQVMDIELARARKYSSMDDYLRMAELKTGSMIEGAMGKGAVIADADERYVEMMGRIGKNMGIAFQIIDDSIDLLGNNRSKSLQNDLRQGKITPMLVYALKNSGKKDRRFLLGVVGKDLGRKNLQKTLEIYRKTGAIEYAQRLSGVYVDRAREEIARLGQSKRINKKALGILGEVVDVLGYWAMMGD